MKVVVVPAPELKHDPYEEECTGAHTGETVVINCDRNEDLLIQIKELRTGIGNIYTITGEWEDQKTSKIVIYVDDDGDLVCEKKDT